MSVNTAAFIAYATWSRSSPSQSTTGSASTTGRRSPTPGIKVKDGKLRLQVLISELKNTAATNQPPGAWPRTSTRWSCICATRSGTASGGGGHRPASELLACSVRSAGAPK